MNDQRGFTIFELLVTVAITAILLSLSAVALRHYFLVQSLDSAADESVATLRQLQQRTFSENHPLMYGVRFRIGSSNWDVVRFDPKLSGTADDECRAVENHSFGSGVFSAAVKVSAGDFSTAGVETYEQTFCRSALGGNTADKFVLFSARGTATAGQVTILQESLGRTETLSVTPITGRVTRT